MTDTRTPLRDSNFMRAFLDLVIPPSDDGKMPGAGRLGLAEGLATKLEADTGLGPPVLAGLRAVYDAALERDAGGLPGLSPDARVEVLESQLASHPALMLGLSVHLYMAYYAHPLVLEGLGEPPRPPFPEGYEVADTDAELLEKLRARRRS